MSDLKNSANRIMHALDVELKALGLDASNSEAISQLKREIKAKAYSVLIHAAAVNGYQFDTVKNLDSRNHSDNSISTKSSTCEDLNKAMNSKA
jgi:short-subunit dehydrogenase